MSDEAGDAITLDGMQFLASVGLLAEERARRQPIEIDVTVWLRPPLTEAGVAAGTVDYRRLYDLAAGVVGAGHTEYLETLALRIVDGALQEPGVSRARVRVRKPHVPLPGPIRGAVVEIERRAGA